MILTFEDLLESKKNTDLLRTKKSYEWGVIKLLLRIKYQFNFFGKIWKIWATVISLLYVCNTDNR